MRFILQKSSALLQKISYPRKFLLIFLIFLLSIGTTSSFYLSCVSDDLRRAQLKSKGLDYVLHIQPLMKEVQRQRGLNSLYLSGDLSVEKDLDVKKAEIEKYVTQLDELDEFYNADLNSSEKWTPIRELIVSLEGSFKTLTTKKSFDDHTVVVNRLILLSSDIAESSDLVLSDNVDQYYANDSIIVRLPHIVEFLGELRAKGASILSSPERDADDIAKVNDLIAMLEKELNLSYRSISSSIGANESEREEITSRMNLAYEKIGNFLKVTKENVSNSPATPIQSSSYFTIATDAIDSVFGLIDIKSSTYSKSVDASISVLLLQYKMTVGFIVVLLIFIVYLFYVFYLSVIDSIHRIEEYTTSVSNGNLTSTLILGTRDETVKIEQSINQMTTSLRDLILKNVEIASNLANTSENLSTSSSTSTSLMDSINEKMNSLTSGVHLQRESFENSSNSMSELNEGLSRVAELTDGVASLSSETLANAESGSEIISRTLDQMRFIDEVVGKLSESVERLSTRSQEIAKITTLITDIASQTKLLALNASIEAARAGEHGRGFAVVASEVGKLAHQSEASAKSIIDLISEIEKETSEVVYLTKEGSREVESGLSLTTSAGSAFSEILESSRRVSSNLQETLAYSEELTATSNVVVEALSSMISVTDSSAQSVEEVSEGVSVQNELTTTTSEISRDLSKMVSELEALTSTFKV